MFRPYLIVDKIGELELIDIFAEYNHPLLFVCRDIFASLYLIVETKYEIDGTQWIASRITENQYNDLVGERCSFESVFRDNSSSFIYQLTDRRNGEKIECSILDSLPAYSSFVGDTTVSELGYDPEYCQQDDEASIEVEAFPNQDIHSVPVEMNKAVCDSIEKTVRSKYGNDYYLECATPRAASYGFRFLVKNTGALSFSTNVDITKDIAKTITSGDCIVNSETIETVHSIAKLYKTLKKYKTDLVVNAVQKNNKCLFSKAISSADMSVYEESLSSFVKDEKSKKNESFDSIIHITGILTAYDVRKKRYEIVSEEGTYSGKFAKTYNVENRIVGLNSTYNAKVAINESKEKILLELTSQSDSHQYTFDYGEDNVQR